MAARRLAATLLLLATTLADVYVLSITAVTTPGFATATPTTHGTSADDVTAKRVSNTSSGAVVTDPGACDTTARSMDFSLHCVNGGGLLSSMCCRTLLEAAESGGLICLCDMAETPTVMTSGYTAGAILAAYSSCGGPLRLNPGDAAKCDLA